MNIDNIEFNNYKPTSGIYLVKTKDNKIDLGRYNGKEWITEFGGEPIWWYRLKINKGVDISKLFFELADEDEYCEKILLEYGLKPKG